MEIAEERLIYGKTTFLIGSRPSERHVITRKQLNWITSFLLRMDQTKQKHVISRKELIFGKKVFLIGN